MMKKLLLTFVLLFSCFIMQGQITMTTTSNSNAWTPTIVNSGNTLTWEAAPNGVYAGQTIIANQPTFDFSGNDGTPIMITVTNSGNDFSGLTLFSLNGASSATNVADSVTDIDISAATALITLNLDYNRIGSPPGTSTLDISQNTELVTLTIRGRNQLYYQTLNTTANTKLESIQIDGSSISNVDFSTNTTLNNVIIENSRLTTPVLDKVVNDLDSHGLNGGQLRIDPNPGVLSYNAYTAYNNLIGKTWTIDAPTPPTAADVKTIVLTTTSNSSTWKLDRVRNNGLIFNWEATNSAIGTITYDDNSPTFDFSQNINEDPITITITSNDGFIGFLEISLYDIGTPGTYVQSKITDFNIDNAVNIERFYPNQSSLKSLDISHNTKLQDLYVHGAVRQFVDQPNHIFDISNHPDLKRIRLENTAIESMDVSVNPAKLYWLDLANSEFTSTAIDQILIDLDQYGMSNPPAPNSYSTNIVLAGNPGAPTAASLTAYNNLIAKGWTIDIVHPFAGPVIQVTGAGNTIPGDNSNTPSTTDDTDFGADVNPITKTFTIENIGNANLDITNVTITGADAADFTVTTAPSTPIAPAGSTTFEVTFNATVIGVKNVTINIASNDSNQSTYTFNIQAEKLPIGPVINVTGNNIDITNNNNATTADGTDFGQVTIGTVVTHTFTIENNGDEDLVISSAALYYNTGGFSSTTIGGFPPFGITIQPGNNFNFDVTYSPQNNGISTVLVGIVCNDASNQNYTINLIAEGVVPVPTGDILFTQYYEGTTNSKWLEIKNISGTAIAANTYYLARYDASSISTIETTPPPYSVAIPAMSAGEVILFRNNAATLPNTINPAVIPTPTDVCNFTGNDVILISASNTANCYALREDILGTIPSTSWGSNIGLIRGGNSTETPETAFDKSHWIVLSPSVDMDNADVNTNLALGTQNVGETIWNGSTWSNLTTDKSRTARVSGTYTTANGDFEAQNLIIDNSGNIDFNGGTNQTITVYQNLSINGTFTLGDTNSLVMVNDGGIVTGNITKYENSTSRSNTHDMTYWSSPVVSANIATVMAGADPNRIFYYDQTNSSASDDSDPTYWNTWVNYPTGTMEPGRGYASEGAIGATGVQSIIFNGTPNNGLIEFDVFENVDSDLDNDFNLIGNPYPSAIDADVFLNANSANLDPVIYLWTHNTAISNGNSGEFMQSDYAIYNYAGGIGIYPGYPTGNPNNPSKVPNGFIASGQGFFVRAINEGLIQFNNSMRIAGDNDQFFKTSNEKNKAVSEEKDRIWLDLTTNEGGFNQLLLGFFEKATDGVDSGYDALRFKNSSNPLKFYSDLDGEKYAIQSLGTFTEDRTIALGFDSKVAPRTMKISIDHAEGALKNRPIYLVDHALGLTHDLATNDYQFELLETGEFKDRFTIQFTAQALGVEEVVKKDFIISNALDGLKINAKQVVETIKVYDMLGRLIVNKKPALQSFYLPTSNIKPGTVLLVNATLENGAKVSRKTIKY